MYWVGEEELIHFYFDSNSIVADKLIPDDSVEGFYAEKLEHLQYMQYTGLKDKNGEKIYEGDILKFEHKEGYANELQVVTMDEWCWGTDEYAFYEIVERKYVFEVIGNIYENPELLGDTK